MNKKLLLYFVITLFIIIPTLASTDFLGTFKTDESINLIQTCASCTYNNITSVTAPDSSLVVSDVAMTKDGLYYNYTLASQDLTGTYNVCGVGDLDGTDTVWCYNFDVTYTGKAYENNLLVVVLVYLFLSALYYVLGIMNKRNIKKDSTKVTTWLMLLSYTMIFIKAIALSYYIYLQYVGADLGSLFSVLFYSDLIVLSGIATFTIVFAILAYVNPDEEKSKWEPEKWG